MGPVEVALLILAVTVPATALSIGAAFWLIFKFQEKHLLNVLDRFLSRNISDYAMTDLVKKEIELDQGEQDSDEMLEEQAFEEYLKNRQAAAELIGTATVVE